MTDPSSNVVTGPTLNMAPEESCIAAKRCARLIALPQILRLSNSMALILLRPAFLLYLSGFLVYDDLVIEIEMELLGDVTMRRRIVALSFRCFFSSDFRLRFSLRDAMRYSFRRCFLSNSAASCSFLPEISCDMLQKTAVPSLTSASECKAGGGFFSLRSCGSGSCRAGQGRIHYLR